MLLLLVAGISAIFLLVSMQRWRAVYAEFMNVKYFDRSRELDDYFKYAQILAAKERFDELNNILEAARQQKRFEFYVLQFQGQTLWYGDASGKIDDVDFPWPIQETAVIDNKVHETYESKIIAPGYQLSIGFKDTFAQEFSSQTEGYSNQLFEEVLYVLLIVLVVGVWTLKDIMRISREVKRGKRANVAKIAANSAEAEMFVKGLTGYAQAVTELEEENRRLGRQVLPSLQKEIHSGRKPPYDFECTMVRTDINHFSTIFNTHNVTEFMATINEFFDEVSRIVARYGGLVHEFVGDEVIYYFKDDEHANSFAIALSAIRDVNEAAQRFNAFTTRERGYPFTVKNSLAHGKVRFGPLVGGFTVAGAVLIETVRILSFITEKDESVAYFDAVNATRLEGLIQSHERMRVKMKGYQSEIGLHQYLTHLPLQHVLDTLGAKTVDHLTYYRDDRAIEMIIADLRTKRRNLDLTLKAIRVLREPYVASPRHKHGDTLSQWIVEETDAKILSAVIKLFINLVPKEEFAPAYKEQLAKLLKHEDRRVVANTVEVLTHFEQEAKIKKPNDLRTAANAIVHEGREEITPSAAKKLKALLKSKKPNEIASGLYALGELAQMHRERDFAYFASQKDLQDGIAQLNAYAQATSTMVRRQALRAARKAQDPKVIERIRANVKDADSELLAEELKRYLDPHTASPTKSSAA